MNDRRELWVIDPSTHHPETQGVAEIVRDWSGPTRLFQPALSPGDGPGPGAGYETAGIVVMGSAASVYDDLPWMHELSAWLRPVLDGVEARPVLGICFGHQLIAHLAGARVGFLREDHSKLVGVEESTCRAGGLLETDRRLRVVVSHREEVQSEPADYRVVARRDEVAIDGIEHCERPIFAYQFHPEAREEFAASVGIPTHHIDDRLRRDSSDLLGAFRDVCGRDCQVRG